MSTGLFDLAGRTAVVTGCNTGLGRAMALGLAQAGADIVGINRSGSADLGSEVAALGRRYVDLRADLSERGGEQALIDAAAATSGRIDILVNNAGIIRRRAAIDFSESDWDDVMELNLSAVFRLSQAAARRFVAQGRGGKIVNVASMLSFQGGVRVPSYTASKSGVLGLTRALANEWAPLGINVNAIAPGYMDTNNTAELRADAQRNDAILARIPAGRWGSPADLAGAIVFLASDAASYVHGHTLAVDGGWLAR
ncbi:2-dehydro-3-deoxy-D-gluconate 5-dehydrogenase KduD [Roseateles sp.]|uniref:2-dehydro-3-deoxy-D-gluconate 5-dehydrogenase KduD n=1 Tax=Roseateles sp. TaxID=1971397 RepID=UPI0025CE96B0|nr:2-dehydro-3-deoxy-D-gluconate 5-dehydrogenase KduD [Roseateles sp.]MBV8036560.1 2-dehydro-3-deoxy-D-gluconate 5-dehydrogenase KduD [Roseateles sp.]